VATEECTALEDGGHLRVVRGWVSLEDTAALYAALEAELPWRQETIRMGAREVLQPRLSAWLGDPDARYTYSRRTFEPEPWTPTLSALRDRLNGESEVPFNSVLANLYRDGQDSMGWHADKEPELGPNPLIASLSLGGTRRFLLRHRRKSVAGVDLDLDDGSLLWMSGTTQHYWRHSVPKTRRPVAPRINLTFRRIQSVN
jgi:alkylated DNA repair dioxygenase AlkB